jgi:hypothetical protein
MKIRIHQTSGLIAAVGMAMLVTATSAAEKFQKLTGSQIRAKVAGMEITDEVHWGDIYERNGTLTTYSMSAKKTGKWSVKGDELCVDRPNESDGCFELWLAGNKVELRRTGSAMGLEGLLMKPRPRR